MSELMLLRTINADGAVGRAGVDEALPRGVGGGKVRADEGLQHRVAPEGLHADVVRVGDYVTARREIRPSVIPAVIKGHP